MSNKKPEPTPAQALRDMIRQQSRRPMVAAAIGDVLTAVDTWVVETERRFDLLAASVLRHHFGIGPTEWLLLTLAALGDSSRMVGRCQRGTTFERRVASLETQLKQVQGMGGAVDEFKQGMLPPL